MDYLNNFASGMFSGIIILLIFASIIGLVALIFGIIGLWKTFQKAGKHGWEAIVPFYNYWILVEIAGLDWWWFLLILSDVILSFLGLEFISGIVSLVSVFALFNCYYNICKKFNKDWAFAIGLTLLSPVFLPILGFSKTDIYNKDIPVSKNGCFGDNSNKENNSSSNQNNVNNNEYSNSFCGNCGTKLDKNTKFCHVCGKKL